MRPFPHLGDRRSPPPRALGSPPTGPWGTTAVAGSFIHLASSVWASPALGYVGRGPGLELVNQAGRGLY